MRYGRYLAGLLVLGIALLFSIQSEAAAKKTIYNSPYVSFSPDGRAFTTLSLIHISEPTRQAEISYAVFCLKKKKKK